MSRKEIYQITVHAKDLFRMLDEIVEGDDENHIEAIQNTLESVAWDYEPKAINMQMYIDTLEGHIEAQKKAEYRIRDSRKRNEKFVVSLKEFLIESMQSMKITKIVCDHFEMKLAKNPQKLEISNPELIPAMYKEKQITAAYIPASMTPEELIKLEKASELFSSIGIEINTNTSILNADIKADLKKDIPVDGAKLTRGTRLAVR